MRTKNTIKRILDAASWVFGKHGYANATMPMIAKKAGVATSTVYFNCTGGKKDILLSILLERLWRVVNTYIEERIKGTEDALTQLELIAETFIELLLKNSMSLCLGTLKVEDLLTVLDYEEPVLKRKKNELTIEFNKYIQKVDEIIIKGQKTGQIVDDLNPAVIRQILDGAAQHLISGLAIQELRGEETGYQKDEIMIGIKYLIRSFGTN
jgi:AcrR family transcriptional regulator